MLFFLLIVFMLELYLFNNPGDVSPPEMNAEPIKSDAVSNVINLKSDGTIVFDSKVISEAELQAVLFRIEQERGHSTEIYLRGDEDVGYGVVMDVMRLVRRIGFRSVNLVTKAEDTQ